MVTDFTWQICQLAESATDWLAQNWEKGGANEQNENDPAYQDQRYLMLQEFANS